MAKRENRKTATLGRLPDTASFAQRTIKGKMKVKGSAEVEKPKLILKSKKKMILRKPTKKVEQEEPEAPQSEAIPLEFLDQEEPEIRDIIPRSESALIPKRKRTISPVAAPVRNCNNCRFALNCTKYEVDRECYYLPIINQWSLDNFDDLEDAFLAISEEQMARMQEAIIEEKLAGGIGTGVATEQLAAAKQAIVETMQLFRPKEKNSSSIIQQIFGVSINAEGVAQTQQFVRPMIEQADDGSRPEYQTEVADVSSRPREQTQVADHVSHTEPLEVEAEIVPTKPKVKELLGIPYTEEERALLGDSDVLSKTADIQQQLEEETARREAAERKLTKAKKPDMGGIVEGSITRE